MKDAAGEGRTVLFVSHNMSSIKNLCTLGILLEDGALTKIDNIESVVDSYLKIRTTRTSIYTPVNNIVKKIEARQNKNKIHLTLTYDSPKPIKQPVFGFVIYDQYDNPITGTNPLQSGIIEFGPPRDSGKVEVRLTSPVLANGIYTVSIWFHDGNAFGDHVFKKEKCVFLEVDEMSQSQLIRNSKNVGHIIPECKWFFN